MSGFMFTIEFSFNYTDRSPDRGWNPILLLIFASDSQSRRSVTTIIFDPLSIRLHAD